MVIGNYWANTGKQVTKSVQKRDSTDWDLVLEGSNRLVFLTSCGVNTYTGTRKPPCRQAWCIQLGMRLTSHALHAYYKENGPKRELFKTSDHFHWITAIKRGQG